MIPRISLASLSTADFRWISSRDWEEADWIQFASLCPIPRRNLSLSPSYVRRSQRSTSVFQVGHWLLKKESQVIGSVSVEGMAASFVKILIHLSHCLSPGGWVREEKSLALIISGLLIMTQADVLILVPEGDLVAQDLQALGWGVCQKLWSPSLRDIDGLSGGPPAISPIMTIAKQEWWQSEVGFTGRKSLAYLEKRVGFEEQEKISCTTPRRPGLLTRLTSWLR